MSRIATIALGVVATLLALAALAPIATRDAWALSFAGHALVFRFPAAFGLLALLPSLWLSRALGVVERGVVASALSLGLRSALVLALALALAEPTLLRSEAKRSIVFAVDVSASTRASSERAARFVREALRARGDVEVDFVRFARDARALRDPSPDALVAPAEGTLAEETDVAGGIRLARALVPPGTVGRVVVLSDGLESIGDAVGEASRARGLGVRVDAVPIVEAAPDDVGIRSITLPDPIEVGAPFELVIRLHATRPRHVRLRIDQGPHANALEPIRELDLAAGDVDVRIRSLVRVPGAIEYRVSLQGDGADAIPGNDAASAATLVPGRPVVLIAEGVRGRELHLARALSAAEFEVETRSPRALPRRREELARYAFVVLSDVASDDVPAAAIDALASWVREDGGALLAAGGDRAFGLGGWGGSAFERLLPIRMEPERRRDQPTLALSLVIDRSGSMEGAKLELAKEAARAAAGLLGSDDAIEVIGFDATPERIVRMQSAGNRLGILRDIGRMAGSGGTMIFPAIDLAYQDLAATRARLKHVILLTDGQSPEDGLVELVQLMRAEGITVSTVGLGSDVNRALLAELAELGGGRSHFTNDPTQVPRIFVRETTTVAQSGVVEEPFVPRVVRDAAFLRGVDLRSAPPLYGYVAARAKPAPAEVILESPRGEPLLARWRVGEGWAIAWTSDVKSRWAAEWVGWDGYSRFFAQLAREHLHRDDTRTLPMRASVEGERVRVVVDALDAEERFLEGLTSRMRLRRPSGSVEAEAPLAQLAPGRYEARLPIHGYGSFLLEADHSLGGTPYGESHATLQHAYPGEFARVEPDRPALARLARAGGGRLIDPSRPQEVFRPDERRVRHEEPVFAWPLGAALGLLVLDVAVRRLARERARLVIRPRTSSIVGSPDEPRGVLRP